jgi:hypothetical protein
VGGLDFIKHLEQGAGETLNSINHFPGLGYGQRRDGVESPVDKSVSVEEQEQRFFFGHIFELWNMINAQLQNLWPELMHYQGQVHQPKDS